MKDHQRLLSLVINTIVKDKQIEDGWRGFDRPVSSRNLANDVDDNVEYDLTGLVGGCVKVIVVKKENFTKFDKLIDSLYSCNLVELKIIEDFSEFEDNAVGEMDLKLDDTITLLNDYVDNTVTDLDKERLKNVLQSLYVEAQHIEV